MLILGSETIHTQGTAFTNSAHNTGKQYGKKADLAGLAFVPSKFIILLDDTYSTNKLPSVTIRSVTYLCRKNLLHSRQSREK